MSEAPDKESRTEEASDKRIRDALEKGSVPHSREAVTFASLFGILIVFAAFSSSVGQLAAVLHRFIDDAGGWTLENAADAVHLLDLLGSEIARVLLPGLFVLCALGLLASLLQHPPQIKVERIKPQASRLSPGQGWRRIFGSQGRIEFLKSCCKLLAVGAIAFFLLRRSEADVINAMWTEPGALPRLLLDVLVRLVAGVTVATFFIALFDLIWSRLSWRRELRMTRQELKEDLKEMDGDPIIRSRMRSLARDRSRRRMMAAVPRATLVIANPTHYAVALRYVREEGGAPRVLAKGRGFIALRIREIAEKHGIPVIEDKQLARSLHDKVAVDQMIPPEFYKAVAQIVYFVMTRKQNARATSPRVVKSSIS